VSCIESCDAEFFDKRDTWFVKFVSRYFEIDSYEDSVHRQIDCVSSLKAKELLSVLKSSIAKNRKFALPLPFLALQEDMGNGLILLGDNCEMVEKCLLIFPNELWVWSGKVCLLTSSDI